MRDGTARVLARKKALRSTTLATASAFALSLMVGTALAVVPALGTASTPISDGGVTPYVIPGASAGGNRTCAEVGAAFFGDPEYYAFSSSRVDYEDGAFVGPFPAGLTVGTDGTFVSFGSTFAVGTVIVKGGSNANVYVYEPQTTSDSGLASPSNPSGRPAELSNVTFCWNPAAEPTQWCSPGYWRQPHHADSWAATGIAAGELYSSYFSGLELSKKASKDGASSNPTLLQVLQSPQWYGGEAFNNVGDLLSEAHPGVNFVRERVADSCPLG